MPLNITMFVLSSFNRLFWICYLDTLECDPYLIPIKYNNCNNMKPYVWRITQFVLQSPKTTYLEVCDNNCKLAFLILNLFSHVNYDF